MLPKMRYRLALDIGTSSIGWGLIRLNAEEEPVAIIRLGTRIFPDGRNPKDGSSLAVTRRMARQMRRRRDRLLKRKQRMMDALVRLGFFPEDPKARKELVDLDPYVLRKKGLYEPLTGGEFARALFHINQRRGFLSNRKTDKQDNESGALKQAIKKLYERLEEENCQTLGEWLANRHESNESVRARLRGKTRKDKAYDFYADRAMIEHEFDTLWEKQHQFNHELFNDNAHDELKDILLHQRPLLPVKPGRCTFIPDQERAPLALPSVQLFRIYQEVNNLRMLGSDLREKPPLTLEQRDQVVAELNAGKNLTFKTGIRKLLGLPPTVQFNLEDVKRDRLKGNTTSNILSKPDMFGDKWHEFPLELQDQIVDKLLNEASESVLVKWLQHNIGIEEYAAEKIANTNLPEGYGNLSKAAIDKIIPELKKEVIHYAEAVKRAGLESHSALSHSQQTGEIMESLPYYGIPLRRHVAFEKENPRNDEERYGKIANPTVHVGLNELRKCVNGLIKRYGYPSEVIVEVTRDLKLSRQKRLDIQKEQANRQKQNEAHVSEACKVLGLNPDTLDKGKRRELSQKMQLWVELNPKDVLDRKCPYIGKQINITKLLSNEVEIEHILPYSRTLDDSLNNKTVSFSSANRDKGNKTPYEAFADNSNYDYEAICDRASLMPKSKARKFAPDGYEYWLRDEKNFLGRSLNDTAYLSRIAKEYLSLICPFNKVHAIPGRMTAMLRGKYGLNQLLSGNSTKNRDDHRHHALDAAVIGITDQGLLQRFAKASASARERGLGRLIDELPLPWPTFREHVERGLKNIVVSHKPDHGYQGAMHEESAWSINEDGTAMRHKYNDDGKKIKDLKTKWKGIDIRDEKQIKRHGLDMRGNPKAYKGYIGGSNYCIEIYRDSKGKWVGEVVSTFDAYQVIRELGEELGIKKLRDPYATLSGRRLVMRLMINDMIKMDVDRKLLILRVVKIGSNGQIFLCEHQEANVDARNRVKDDDFKYISKTAGSLQKANARRVSVSIIGDLKESSFKG